MTLADEADRGLFVIINNNEPFTGGKYVRDRVALFYNPVAGMGKFKYKLDDVIRYLQRGGLQVMPMRIENNEKIKELTARMDPQEYHTIVAAGGDGTIHGVVNAMMQAQLDIPLAIFPEGTSNDVARFMNIPGRVKDYCRIITHGKLTGIDLGQVNDEYIINVASAGFLTDTAHEVTHHLKNALGKVAYYLKVLEKLPQMRPLHLHLTVDGKEYEMDILLFLILNGGSAAGLKEMLPSGTISDGMLDLLAFKPAPPLGGLDRLLINYSRGQLLQDANVFYCQGRDFRLDLNPPAETDLDGERGPALPWTIKVCPNAIQLRTPL